MLDWGWDRHIVYNLKQEGGKEDGGRGEKKGMRKVNGREEEREVYGGRE
jgi:hypothetical protein